MADNRRSLEVARRHTSEEVQGLRASLEKAQKEQKEQRLAHAGQQRTSTQVEEELQAQLTALERARDDAIESLTDFKDDLDRSDPSPVGDNRRPPVSARERPEHHPSHGAYSTPRH